jgi:hypothetical protein
MSLRLARLELVGKREGLGLTTLYCIFMSADT